MLLAPAILVMVGCETTARSPSIRPSGARAIDNGVEGAAWPFWPRRMRIHPLSRFATDRETGALLIEARLEFSDSEKHTTKALGQVRLDLHSAMASESAVSLETWNEDLRDLGVNASRFDEVTRTYLLRLEVDESLLPERASLKAYYLGADGQELRAEYKLPAR